MKQSKNEMDCPSAKTKRMKFVSHPPPPPPLPRLWARKRPVESETKKEIIKFWRKKRIEEEEHLLAAIKSAARVRARNLSDEDYKRFIESLDDKEIDEKTQKVTLTNDVKAYEKTNNEVRVGIKDWWTKSNYAYLNQPALQSMDKPKRLASSYTPNRFCFKPTTPLYATSLGVF